MGWEYESEMNTSMCYVCRGKQDGAYNTFEDVPFPSTTKISTHEEDNFLSAPA